MFDNDDGPAYCSDWDLACDEWCCRLSEEFEICVSENILDHKYLKEIAQSLAFSNWMGEELLFFSDNGLNDDHAICYLHMNTNRYQVEVDEKFQEYLINNQDFDEDDD